MSIPKELTLARRILHAVESVNAINPASLTRRFTNSQIRFDVMALPVGARLPAVRCLEQRRILLGANSGGSP